MSSLPEDSTPVLWRPSRLWAPWWLALLLGGALGFTLTLLRIYKAFVVPGAISLAVIIAVITIATILRRQTHAEALEPPVSLSYVLWMAVLVVLVGPVQVVLVPANPREVVIKAVAVSVGLAICIYGADRALFASLARPGKPRQYT